MLPIFFARCLILRLTVPHLSRYRCIGESKPDPVRRSLTNGIGFSHFHHTYRYKETAMNLTSNSRRSPLSRFAPLALLLLASVGLHAEQPVSFSLSGAAEVPAVTTSASGKGEITVMPDRTVSGSIKISGMNPTMAHIHEAAAGKNGPSIITLSRGSNDSYSVPAGTKLTDAQYASYKEGMLYVNVHSAQYPDGELRGQLPKPKH